jgi:hypothetical protein
MNSTDVKAVRYNITVYEGMMDMVYGGGEKITEIFIPSSKVVIDSKGRKFKCKAPRDLQEDLRKYNFFTYPLTEITF